MKALRVIIAVLIAGSVLSLIVVAIAGPASVRATLRRGWLLGTGRLVDVGGYALRVDCQGAGRPTVVMDAGVDQSRSSWFMVPAQVAQFTRVCTYDRANIGDSDAAPRPRTSREMVEDLRRLTARARAEGPLVLVGHSFGALNVQLYASTYPEDVAGMVLVDGSGEDQPHYVASALVPEQRDAYLDHESGINLEGVDVITSGRQVRARGALPLVPLVVLSADPQDEHFRQVQVDLARRIPGGRHIIVPNASHFIQFDRPDVVTSAVREVVEEARRTSARARLGSP
jgi:pimeloyl-ACP methyl ester carboxylesterase